MPRTATSPSKKSKSRSKGTDTSCEDEATHDVSTRLNLQVEKKVDNNMSDTPSILEFSEDIATQEPPVPLPVGDYPAEIRGAEIKTSQRGNKYVSVKFYVAPESYPADYTDGNSDGEILTYNRLVYDDSPRGRHRMRKFTESIGAPNSGNKINVNDWVGCTANLAIAEEEFEGEKRAVIAKVNAA